MFLCTWPTPVLLEFPTAVHFETLPRHAFPGACRALLHPQTTQRKKRSRWEPRRVLRSKTLAFPWLYRGRDALGTPALLNSFCGSQLRAARPRIAIDLFFAGRHRLLGKQLVATLLRSFAERIFHNAVFQRVETDDH